MLKMSNWSLSPAEMWRRIAGITALLATLFCAVYFFRVWFLAGLSVMTNPKVIIPLGIAAWIFLIYAGIKKIRGNQI